MRILGSGAEGKGETPPLPRRKTKNLPEELEDTMDKPKTQVNIDPNFLFKFHWCLFAKEQTDFLTRKLRENFC